MKHQLNQTTKPNRRLVRAGVLVLIAAATGASPAFAQIDKLTTVMDTVKTALLSISVVAFTIAIAWAGYKMAFQHAKWSEVSNIVIGAVLVGGAAAIATLFVG